MIEVGKVYYIIAHAYHHYVCEVVEVTPRWVKTGRCLKIMSDARTWETFFREGIAEGRTNYLEVPDGTLLPVGNLPVHPYEHPLPERKPNASSARRR